MIKFSRLADYAVVILAELARAEEEMMAASALACKSNLPEPTVAKVLKLLAKGDVIVSIRGVNGGYKLARAQTEITVADVVTAVDGPVCLTTCVENSEAECEHACHCMVKGRWDQVNHAISAALEGVSLADMLVDPYDFINTSKSAS